MKNSKEFEKLFPKSTWSNEEIAASMFTPDDDLMTENHHHKADKDQLKIDVPIDVYAKEHKLIDLDDFLKEYRNKVK